MHKISLELISQEKHLLSQKVDKIVVPGAEGEMTILPQHIPLFTRLKDGVVTLFNADKKEDVAILGGFMDVGPQSKVTILADAAIHTDNINIAKAEEAKKQAEAAIANKTSEVEFKLAEASLRRALLELKVARRKKPHQQIPTPH